MANANLSFSSQRRCILCGAKIPPSVFAGRDVKFNCPDCGIKFHKQQCGRRSERIRIYYGHDI